MLCVTEAQANRVEYNKEKCKGIIKPGISKIGHCGRIKLDLHSGFKYPYLTYLRI